MPGAAKKALLGGVTVVVMALGLPVAAASADLGDTIIGHCSAQTEWSPTLSQTENEGVIEVTAVMLTSAHLPDANADVQCKIQVNGVDAPGTDIDCHANAVGVVQCQERMAFDDQNASLPSQLCERDTWSDGDHAVGSDANGWTCQAFVPNRTPEHEVTDLVSGLLDTVFATVICPVLEQLDLGHCVEAAL